MFNTPPCFSVYLLMLVTRWLKAQGGLAGIDELNRRKAGKLYTAIDNSNFYHSPVQPAVRSLMNVPFTMPDAELDSLFVAQATERGMSGLKGHRSVGGIRASIYNAVPEDAVDALIGFMHEFENEHG
jgi:phosphoserine aminotransferase